MARPPQDPQIRITEILDTAEPLFYASGYHETGISDIAKKMGVAQGTIYYYFASKDQLLEALINRKLSALTSEIKIKVHSQKASPLNKFEIVLQSLLQAPYREDGLLFEFLFNDHTIHFLDKLARQGKKLINSLLLEIIEEGNQQHCFNILYPQAVINIVMTLIDSLFEIIYDKSPEELLHHQSNLTEEIIETLLGVKKGSIHIIINA